MRSRTILLPKMLVIFLLSFIYTLGFIITPYWINVDSKLVMIFILALTIGIGALWSYFSAEELQIRVEPINWIHFLILLAVLIILNLRPLISSVPWRGDEDTHIGRTIALASKIPIRWVFVFSITAILSIFLAWKKSKWAIFFGISFLAGVIFLTIAKNPLAGINSPALLHYPFISYWFFAVIPKLAMLFKFNPYQEIFFRIVPFLSTLGLVWVFQNQLSESKTTRNILWGIAAATIPLVYYYSSILYLELPAVFLMFIVCINIKKLLQDDFQDIRKNPSWYALILIGFIKETTIPFLFCFLGWRLISSVLQRRNLLTIRDNPPHKIVGELRIAFAVLLPVAFYLFLRGTLSQQSRGFSLTISHLVNILVYRTIVQSFLQQFGVPLILLFLGGCVLLFWKKEYLSVGFLVSLAFLYPIFYAVDILEYTGYSRFNLFVLPAILAGSIVLIKQLMIYKKIFGISITCAILAINFWNSPVSIDGSKKPLWGNYLADTSEHYYPYHQALEWLKINYKSEPILFTGMYYHYFFDFYFGQLNWTPENQVLITNMNDNDTVSLSRGLAEADATQYNIVLFQVLGSEIPDISNANATFYEEKIFKNDAHTLVIYHRIP